MSGWPFVRLDSCTEIVSGATPSTSESSYWSGDICWATPKDLSELDGAYISDTPRKITPRGLASCSADVLPPQSVLFSSRAPIGHVAINTVPMATNQGFKSFVPHPDRVDAKFLYYWLRTNRRYLESLGNGATFKEVSKRVVSRVEMPLPPLAEQRRIAEILDKADALRAKRRAALAQLDTITQSIFLDMFGDPAANPKQWPLRALGSVAIRFSDGPFGSNLKTDHYQSSGIRVIRLQNIGVNAFLDNDRAFISESHFERLSKHECRPGDVLIATLGDPNLRACVLPSSIPIALNKADCVQMRPNPQEASSLYLSALLNQPGTLALAQELMRGQTRVRISMGRLRELRVPIAPLSLQDKFAREIHSMECVKNRHVAAQSGLDGLFASLQHRAFRGEL